MKMSALPPVRREVPVKRSSVGTSQAAAQLFPNRCISLYASGTAALARAIAACASRKSSSAPEVIIPAYGCPDLVAACIHASVYPLLVDVAPSHWAYDLDALKRRVSDNTVAIIAVNLLGIGDGSTELSDLCRTWNIPLIQDSAQFLPRQPIEWLGHYVVLSFGRGKPMNLLHGGALIAPSLEIPKHDRSATRWRTRDRLLATRAAAIAFNLMSLPRPYWFLSRLPATRIGQVVYKPLTNPAPLPKRCWLQVGSAFEDYRERESYRRRIWEPAIAEWSQFGITELLSSTPPSSESLRLALLAPDRRARDTLVKRLGCNNLGASRLYAADLTRIAGVPDIIRRQGPFPNAAILADRLFTLPTHQLVTPNIVTTTCSVIGKWNSSYSRS